MFLVIGMVFCLMKIVFFLALHHYNICVRQHETEINNETKNCVVKWRKVNERVRITHKIDQWTIVAGFVFC